ncbi:hypothetical protein BCR44DRAFT_1446200 [Catenaria anguillulae PL171]|uniref:Uncharacterized protein n=1 Tax=Catenaria anguillulae PL171 TaxID=765915 RepID=A0A1Y2HAQ5_9FUNG|nr:hypothetical protein BCR44DRAFT_1446200 [Catenaria anguillulae PL171]
MSRPSARTDTARPTTSAGLQSTSVASNDLRALVTTHGCHYRLPNTTSDPTQQTAFNQQVLALEQGEKEMIRERLAAILFSVTTTDLRTIAAALRIQSGRGFLLSSKNVDDAKNKLKTKVNDASKSLKEVAKLFKGGSALDRLKHACIMRLANRCRVGNNGDRTNWSLVSAIMERTKQNRAEADRLVAWEHLFSDLRTVYDAVIESDIEPDAVPAFSDVDFCVRYCTCLTISNDHAVSLSFDHQRDDATNGGHIGADFETALLEWRPEEAAANDQARQPRLRLVGDLRVGRAVAIRDFILDDGSAAVSDENVDGHRFSIEEHEAVQPPTQHRRLHTPATPLARRNSFARDPQPSTYTPHMGQSQRHDPRASDDELYFSDEQYTGDNRPGAVRPISGGRPKWRTIDSIDHCPARFPWSGKPSGLESRVGGEWRAACECFISRGPLRLKRVTRRSTWRAEPKTSAAERSGSVRPAVRVAMESCQCQAYEETGGRCHKQTAGGGRAVQTGVLKPLSSGWSQRQANKGKGRAGRHAKHSVNKRDDGVEEDGAEEDTAQAKKVVALRKQGNRRSTRSRT